MSWRETDKENIFHEFSWFFLFHNISNASDKSELTPRADILVGITVSCKLTVQYSPNQSDSGGQFLQQKNIQILRFQGPWRAPDHLK